MTAASKGLPCVCDNGHYFPIECSTQGTETSSWLHHQLPALTEAQLVLQWEKQKKKKITVTLLPRLSPEGILIYIQGSTLVSMKRLIALDSKDSKHMYNNQCSAVKADKQ